jgi:pilus assembly protein FimV
MDSRARVLGLALLCVTGASHGLVLGAASGAALIGRPLDLVIQVHGAAAEDALSSCFQADVLHGDVRQDASGVRVSAQAGAQVQAAQIHITSAASVDEPIVTVQVRAICGQKVSRQYVMLADLPGEVVLPATLVTPLPAAPALALARLDPPAEPPAEAGASATAARAVSQADLGAARAAPGVSAQAGKPAPAAKAAPKRRPVPKVAAIPPRPPASKEARPVAAPVAKARLVLDSLEMLSDRVATLESATAEAMKPDLSTDARKVQTLEADVKALLALAAKNEASLADLKARLQQAESERLPSTLFYGLLALFLAALAALGIWSRRRRDTSAWSDVAPAPQPLPQSQPQPQPQSSPQVAMPMAPPELAPQSQAADSRASRLKALSDQLDQNGPSSEIDVSLIEMSESNFDNLMQSGAPHNAIRVAAPARPSATAAPAASSAWSSDAVFDIRQQAEFFVSLGQPDRAIRILEEQISATDAPNPLVYLDLLALLHAPSHKTDFRRVREDFNLLFNANAPEFALFKDEGKGLEAYPDVLSAIAKLWPDPKVLAVIETCVLRDPWGSGSQPFDMAAFRDLLFLHALAQTLLGLSAATPVGASVSALAASRRENARAATPASSAEATPGSTQPDILLVDADSDSQLDVDLTDHHSAGPVTVPTAPR